jgi:hypothetical protein
LQFRIKSEPVFYGGNSILYWVDKIPRFAKVIANKLLNDHDLQFEFFQMAWVGPMLDEPGADRHPDADVLQTSVSSGYLKKHGLKVLTVVLPEKIILML